MLAPFTGSYSPKPFSPDATPCKFTSGTLDYLLAFLTDAGIKVLFDLNELCVTAVL